MVKSFLNKSSRGEKMITLNVNSLENAEIFWKELGLEDEVALNETYDPNPETLAISVETIDEIHDKIIELGLPVSPITPAVDGRFMFSFIAPEDNTFIVIGEWVERPYTGEMRTEFFENVKGLIPLAPERLSELTEGQFVLFGRVTCPWTRRFVKALPDYADKMIYYVDTENTDLNPELQAIRRAHEVETVPTFMKRSTDGTFVKFDKKKESLSEFIK